MKEIIVPDIHEQFEKLNKLESRLLQADRVIFLGDWFDSFNEPQHIQTAWWLKKHIDIKGWEFLLGNHDCHYAFSNAGFICSGYSPKKKEDIANILTIEDWAKFKVFAYTHDKEFLLSHAGLRPETAHFLNEEDAALQIAQHGGFGNFWSAGVARGGYAKFGGPTWLDFNREFRPIDAQRQIVGHTSASAEIRRVRGAGKNGSTGNNYCIDTGFRHAAFYEDGTLEFLKLEDLK
jgi:hypothetical protein